jgi:eukaryotic-like serine/threonine-protein kinase
VQTARMSTLTGTRISRYQILELLGIGGMGEVYRARDGDLQRDVAIKFLPQAFASSPERLARFGQEARTASSLNHPNIITIHEIGAIPGGPPYIVMEYVEGHTLRTLLQEAPLPVRQILDIAAQLADGMGKAHTAGIVHRDLKPENVMVTADGFVKILDFGLAKLRGGVHGANPAETRVDTQDTALSPDTVVGALIGTAAYMSPEQARGEHADFHADQFAMGVMAYEMATGRPPFRGPSVVQTLAAIIETEPEPISASRIDFPPPARTIVERCLAKNPRARFASTVDLARELRQVRDRLSGDASTRDRGPVVPVTAPRPRRGSRRAAFGATGLALALLAYLMSGPVGRWLSPLPAEMRLAVLPVVDDPVSAGHACCPGLQEYVTGRLAELQRFRNRLIVVPAAEVRDAGARSPSAARRALGANLAVTISVHDAGSDRQVTIGVSDTAAVRQLRGDTRRFSAAGFAPESIVEALARLLDLELQPDAARTWNGTASAVPAAGALFAQALGQTPYEQARSALEQIDQQASLERAIDLFNRAVDADPRYAAAHAGLAEARLRLFRLTKRADDLALASQSSERALALDDTRPAAWTTRGMVRSAHGDIAGAEGAFSEAIKRNPAGGDAYRELGIAYLRAGQFGKAEAAHRKSLELDPKSWAAYSQLAVFLMRRQRFEEAERVLRRGLEVAPGNRRLLSNLGATYLSQRRWADAEATLNKAVRDGPYGPALSNLGWLQFRVKRQYAAAARTFEHATAASPRDYRLWKNLGDAYRHAPGERERSTAALTTAVRLLEEERAVYRHNPKVLAELGDCHAMLGHADLARPLIGEARRLAPADGDVAYTAATAYEAVGDRGAALAALGAALGAGYDRLEIESDTGLERLRADPRYAKLLAPLVPEATATTGKSRERTTP